MQIKQIVTCLNKILLLIVVSSLGASTPKIKTFKTQQDFESGQPVRVSINYYGEISLAPKIAELFKCPLPFLWAGTTDSRGNVYVAGGNVGQVYRIDPNGNSSLIFETDELQIYALAVDNQNNLFVASSPQGKVYKVPSGNQIRAAKTVFFDPEEVYIWSLVVDKQDNVFVATGEKGNVYKVDKEGNATLFYESEDSHVRKIILDGNGNIVAGTSNKGMVLRLDSGGNAFVLYDSPLVEITDLLEDQSGNIYAAASGESQVQRGVPKQQTKKITGSTENGGGKGDNEEDIDLPIQQITVTASPGGTKQRGELYRIDGEGTVRTFQTLKSERIYSLVSDESGNILLGAGEEGRLYAMTPNGEQTLLTKLEEIQITLLKKGPNGAIHIGTSNTGKVYRLSHQFNSSGHLISEVIDTGVASQWGAVSWQADLRSNSNIVVQTRSGNTESPDKTWSPWSENYSLATGQHITSPPARYIQVKTILSTKDSKISPILKELSFSYLQKNIAPEIKQVYVHPPGEYYPEATSNGKSNSHLGSNNGSDQSSFQNHSFGRKSQRKGFRSVSWVTHDENGDKLSYSLFYRGEDEKNWKTLVEEFKGIVFSWDSELLPDGRYLIKLEARDDLSNPPSVILTSEKISQPFTVDNSGPEVSEARVQNQGSDTVISFIVIDDLMNIQSVEYSVNAEKWNLVYPVDGICDSKREEFEFKVESLVKGENSIVIKALDSLGNIGFGKSNIKL